MQEETFDGRRVVTFESRRRAEMASLVERHGGVPIAAPALREVRFEGDPEPVRAFGRALLGGEIEVVILLTGVGTRALLEDVAREHPREEVVAALGRTRLIARGPKPAAALREVGLRSFEEARSPSTRREVIALLGDLRAGERVVIQEYGAPEPELVRAIEAKGARVDTVPVYRWALPEDTAPLRRGIAALASGEASVALFTSRAQVEHVALIAQEEGMIDPLRAALRQAVVVASVGPVCSEALRGEGFPVDVEPDNPKMGPLVREAARRARSVLAAKR